MSKQSFVILSTTEGQIYLTHTATILSSTLGQQMTGAQAGGSVAQDWTERRAGQGAWYCSSGS
jgi:hypothetical protein